MFEGCTIARRPRARAVVCDHAAQGRPGTGGHVRAEDQPVGREKFVQLVQNNARAHAHRPGLTVKIRDEAVVPAQVEHEPVAHRAAGQAAARTPRYQRNVGRRCSAHDLGGLLHTARKGHAPRRHLIDGGVRRVQLPRHVVQKHRTRALVLYLF